MNTPAALSCIQILAQIGLDPSSWRLLERQKDIYVRQAAEADQVHTACQSKLSVLSELEWKIYSQWVLQVNLYPVGWTRPTVSKPRRVAEAAGAQVSGAAQSAEPVPPMPKVRC